MPYYQYSHHHSPVSALCHYPTSHLHHLLSTQSTGPYALIPYLSTISSSLLNSPSRLVMFPTSASFYTPALSKPPYHPDNSLYIHCFIYLSRVTSSPLHLNCLPNSTQLPSVNTIFPYPTPHKIYTNDLLDISLITSPPLHIFEEFHLNTTSINTPTRYPDNLYHPL